MNRSPLYMISVLAVLLGASSYGVLSPFIKLAYNAGFSFEQVTVHQTGMGMLLLWLIALLRWKRWRSPDRMTWIKLSFIGICGLALTTVLYNKALERLDASLAIVLLFQFTWITILLDSLRNRKWPSKFRLAAIVLVMAGTWLAVGILEDGLTRIDGIGIVLGLLSAVTYSMFIWLTGRLRDGTADPVIKSAIMLTAGFAFICLLYGAEAGASPREGTLLGWGLLLGTLGQVIPTITFNIGIPRIGSSLAALLGSMELPVAALSAWVILSEQPSVWKLLGIALILLGIGIAELPSGGSRRGQVWRKSGEIS
jgi:drug/metabolite transporter (DMT)-like permease